MPIQVLRRDVWDGVARKLADFYRFAKTIDDRAHAAVIELWSHIFGWELRLLVDDGLVQSRVCRTQDEVLDTMDRWRAGLLEKGWA